jgi:SAM-dependent methyltransferase
VREHWDLHAYGSEQLDWPQAVYLRLLRPALAGKRVLELGCGSGYLSGALANSAREVTAVDFSEAMLERARARFGGVGHLQFVHADVLNLDLGQQFDVLCGVMVLHEISSQDYPMLIGVLKRHMAPGSFGWFQENSFFNPGFRFFRTHLVGRFGVPKYGSEHETPFDRTRMAALCDAFRYCERSADAFVLFQLVHGYLIRSWGTRSPFVALDRIITGSPISNRVKLSWTYYQNIYFSDDRLRAGVLGRPGG